MWTAEYDPRQRVILVEVVVHGPLGSRRIRCLLDTGTSATIIDTAIIDELGYSARMGKGRSRLVAIGTQEGYRLEVTSLETMGYVFESCEIRCHDFQDDLGFAGLVGMDLLEGRILTIDGVRGMITTTDD